MAFEDGGVADPWQESVRERGRLRRSEGTGMTYNRPRLSYSRSITTLTGLHSDNDNDSQFFVCRDGEH
jgi:hypothetical protein